MIKSQALSRPCADRRPLLLTGAVLAAGLVLSGCATRNFVRDEVAVVDQRVNATDTRLGVVEGTANDALQRATAAQQLAEGKFMYEVVLSDDSVKFPSDRDALSPEAEARLTELANRLKAENVNVYLEIQGHTDSAGPDPTTTPWVRRGPRPCAARSAARASP